MSKLTVIVLVSITFASTVVPRSDDKIIGGHEVNIENYPHQVSFQYNGKHICGATIISKSFVITAAHCTDGLNKTQIKFRAGSSNRYEGGNLHDALEIIQHEKYNKITNDYDFSLVKVSPLFNLTSNSVAAIKIASIEPTVDLPVDITGWGATFSNGSTSPDQLMGASIKIVSRDSCNSIYDGTVTNRMICAAGPGKDACIGDSGGPLIDPKITMLYGIVSWGIGCANPDYPGVYSSIANQRAWIGKNIGAKL